MKSVNDLMDKPEETVTGTKTPEAPVKTVINHLVTTHGDKLNILTRTNPNLAKAAQVGLIHSIKFGPNCYVARRVELIKQLAISLEGKGRDDLNAALQAGGSLPDSYFEGNGVNSEFNEGK